MPDGVKSTHYASARTILLCCLAASLAGSPARAADRDPDPLFSSHAVLPLTIEAPLTSLRKS